MIERTEQGVVSLSLLALFVYIKKKFKTIKNSFSQCILELLNDSNYTFVKRYC